MEKNDKEFKARMAKVKNNLSLTKVDELPRESFDEQRAIAKDFAHHDCLFVALTDALAKCSSNSMSDEEKAPFRDMIFRYLTASGITLRDFKNRGIL